VLYNAKAGPTTKRDSVGCRLGGRALDARAAALLIRRPGHFWTGAYKVIVAPSLGECSALAAPQVTLLLEKNAASSVVVHLVLSVTSAIAN
jgi:hypothetical protein